ncbi:MAG: nickel pincer cofactor biosynthesis protein LarC, partial [Pyrinomonadaceae bacterium]
MILAALAALGIDKTDFVEQIKQLDIPEFEIKFTEVDRSGIAALLAEVKVPNENKHRHLRDIQAIIERSRLSRSVKDRAIAVFERLADAEAKIHGTDVQSVHFHEVGAMDAIVDIVGSCIGFEILGIERFICSKIHIGSGFVQMAHGKYPVPPPAVTELLKGIPVYSTDIEGELITPTGAAIISTVCDSYGALPEMIVEISSYGAGTRAYDEFPNALRLFVGQSTETAEVSTVQRSTLTLIETNIDDLSP